MRVARTVLVDIDTGMRVIATDCSFNHACSYLDSLFDMSKHEPIIERESLYVTHIHIDDYHFVYNEERGMLFKQEDRSVFKSSQYMEEIV